MADRIEINKTYKVYIGGKFPRSESGRYYKVFGKEKRLLANACRCSRKDVRDAVTAARSAFKDWSGRSAYNRGQILYRIAEMLEGRKAQFRDELVALGSKPKSAEQEVLEAIDRLIYYAGWTDKYQQVFGSVNPVASSHFNFSVPEPTGVVGIFAPQRQPLLGLVSVIAPVIAGGNTCVVLASQPSPLPAVSFAEVMHTSDIPGGVVTILTGSTEELTDPLSSHMNVDACFVTEAETIERFGKQIQENASLNIKRVIFEAVGDWLDETARSPYFILNFQEIKTTWHPVGF